MTGADRIREFYLEVESREARQLAKCRNCMRVFTEGLAQIRAAESVGNDMLDEIELRVMAELTKTAQPGEKA
jgi:hypothetical protein